MGIERTMTPKGKRRLHTPITLVRGTSLFICPILCSSHNIRHKTIFKRASRFAAGFSWSLAWRKSFISASTGQKFTREWRLMQCLNANCHLVAHRVTCSVARYGDSNEPWPKQKPTNGSHRVPVDLHGGWTVSRGLDVVHDGCCGPVLSHREIKFVTYDDTPVRDAGNGAPSRGGCISEELQRK